MLHSRWVQRIVSASIVSPFPYRDTSIHLSLTVAIVAYLEMRLLTAQLLLKFDIAFAPGEDGTRIRTMTKDHFTTVPGSLDLVFTPVAA